ncbi:translation initiation factor IF-2-like [Accipiter gentilis]|uniref:translation initiation factor IF-2-like n=1 Tax=Astur gentilis TaxID=8957 RepID=UPI00210FD6A9|nr:translation initiation factor IF-2-like [Accipiter gentilis]
MDFTPRAGGLRLSPPSGGRSRLYPPPSRQGRLPLSVSAPARSGPHAPPRGKWYTPPAGPERRAPPGGAGRGAPPLVGTGAGRLRAPRQPGAVPVPVPVPVPRRHPARPWSCRRSVGAAPCRRATPGLLPSLRAIGLGRSGNKAAAARSRNLACPCPSPTLGRRTGGRRQNIILVVQSSWKNQGKSTCSVIQDEITENAKILMDSVSATISSKFYVNILFYFPVTTCLSPS